MKAVLLCLMLKTTRKSIKEQKARVTKVVDNIAKSTATYNSRKQRTKSVNNLNQFSQKAFTMLE